jgi:ParB-like nuclease domain
MTAHPAPRHTTDDLQVLRLDQLVLLNELQVRVQLDPETVREYTQLFRDVPADKCTCPPITVYRHEDAYVVSDGFHRVTAAKRAGRTTLNAYVHTGTLDDAWLNGMQTNIAHGKPYSRDDKQKIVLWLLNHPRYGTYSTRDLAALAGNMVAHGTVANLRNRLQRPPNPPPAPVDSMVPGKPPAKVLSNLDTSVPARPPGTVVSHGDNVSAAPVGGDDPAPAPTDQEAPTLQEALEAAREAVTAATSLLPFIWELEDAIDALRAAEATVTAFLAEDDYLEMGCLADALKELIEPLEAIEGSDFLSDLDHVEDWVAEDEARAAEDEAEAEEAEGDTSAGDDA